MFADAYDGFGLAGQHAGRGCTVEDGHELTLKDDDDCIPDEQRLFTHLLAGTEPAVRPVYNSTQPVLVHFQLGLYQIVGLVWFA